MKKYLLLLLAAFFLTACETSQGSHTLNNESYEKEVYRVTEDACQSNDADQCFALGNAYYAQGKYKEALNSYDSICQKQYVPACLKMATMFEKGQGSPVNLEYALDIHTKACYLGYDKNCDDMRRLQKKLGIKQRR